MKKIGNTGIREISYPNTAIDSEKNRYTVGRNCDEINYIFKGGEMGPIRWLEIIKDGKKTAEIKEDVCNIYF